MDSESDDTRGNIKTLKAYYGKQLYGITRTREFEIPSGSKQILPITEDEVLVVVDTEFHLYKQGQKNQTIQTGSTQVGYVQYDEKSDSIFWIAREDRTLRKMNKTTGEAEIVERLQQSVESFVLTGDDGRVYQFEYKPWYRLTEGTQLCKTSGGDFKSRGKLTCFSCNVSSQFLVAGVKSSFPSLVRKNASGWPSLSKSGYMCLLNKNAYQYDKIEQLDNGNGRIRNFYPSNVCFTKEAHILICDPVNNEIHVLCYNERQKKYKFEKGINIDEEFGNVEIKSTETLLLKDISIFSDILFVRLKLTDDNNVPINDKVVCCKLISSNLSSKSRM